MAIWQFTFYWVPRDAVEKLHGPDAIALASFAPVDPKTWDENAEEPNYWVGRSPQSYAPAIEALHLHPRKSWSPDALMFGDEDGDGVELWDDHARIRLDIREFDEALARALVSIAARDDLKLAMGETGRLIPATWDKLSREIANSRALKFARDPIATLKMIGREQE